MKYRKIRDTLDGLHAYDTGCVDSGTHDPALKARVFTHLASLPPAEHRALIARLTIDLWLSPEALAHGYGAEDAYLFLRWLEDEGGLISA